MIYFSDIHQLRVRRAAAWFTRHCHPADKVKAQVNIQWFGCQCRLRA